MTSKHPHQIVSRLPLRMLQLNDCAAFESLSFLSECPHLAQSLQSLVLESNHATLHSTELSHVLTLKNLTSVDVFQVFIEPLDAFAQHLLKPPSVVLPKLTNFEFMR